MEGIAPPFRAVGLQEWCDLTFLHWRYPPAAVRPLLPPGLRLETVEGSAWVGVTPFLMRGVRAPGLPALPHLSTFPEVNCRTYVRHTDGTSGIWFFSLDTPRLWFIAALRTIGLPYLWARAQVDRTRPDRMTYRSRRVGPRAPAELHAVVEVGDLIDAPAPLTRFLTARWWAFTRRGGVLWRVPVSHPDWPLRAARAVVADAGGLSGRPGCPSRGTRRSSTSPPGCAPAWGCPDGAETTTAGTIRYRHPDTPVDEGR